MNKHKKPFYRRPLSFFISALLLLLSTLLLAPIAEGYLKKRLPQWVAQGTDELYQLSFSAVDLKLMPLSVVVSDLALVTDSIKAAQVHRDSPDKILYNFHSPNIEVRNIGLLELLGKQVFHCRSLEVYQPELTLSGAEIFENDTSGTYEKILTEMQPLFKEKIKRLVIDEINFIDANYQIYGGRSAAAPLSNAKEATITIKKFETDSLLIFNPARLFESEDIRMVVRNSKTHLADSLHILTIDKLEYSLKTSDIFAQGFHLYPLADHPHKNRYDVTVPQLHLKSRSLVRFSVQGTMDVQQLTFRNPQIKFYQKEQPEKLDIEALNEFDLYALVENQFTDIDIDTFRLENANLEIYRRADTLNYQQQFQSINIALFGFMLDSASSKNNEKLFHANELEMFVHGYHLRLEDNRHEFSADSMFISTLTNTVGTENIRISPLAGKQKQRTTVNLQCKALQIENVDLKTLFHRRILPTRKIQVVEPRVHIQYHTEIEAAGRQSESGLLFELVSAYLKGVYAEVVEIDRGALNIRNSYRQKEIGYFQTDFDFLLSGFALDDESMKRTDKFFYASHFDLQFTDYQMKLVDNLHKVNVDRVSVLSLDRRLQILNLRLIPTVANADKKTMKQFSRSELYRITVPKIAMRGVNLRDAFFYKKLNMTEFSISAPELYLENFGQLRQEKEKTEKREIYDLIFNYISDFNIKKMALNNGKFTWVNHTRKGKTISFDNAFSATLQNFRLNTAELQKQRLLFSDQFSMSVFNPVFALSDSVHVLRAAQIDLSTATSSINIRDAHLLPSNESENFMRLPTTLQAAIPQLQIRGIDFQKAWFDKHLKVGKLELNNSEFKVYSKKEKAKPLDLSKFKFPMPVFLHQLNVDEMHLNNTQVHTFQVLEQRQTESSNFIIDLTMPEVSLTNTNGTHAELTTQNVHAEIRDFNAMAGKNHQLELQKLQFDRSRQSISVSNVRVTPLAGNKATSRYTISVPSIKFSGFRLNEAFAANRYIFSTIEVQNPEISIRADSLKTPKMQTTSRLDIYPFVEPYVDQIKIGSLQANRVHLNYSQPGKLKIDRQFNIRFNTINIAGDGNPEQLFHAEEFEIFTENIHTKSKDGNYQYTAGSFIYNSREQGAKLTDVRIEPLVSREEFNQNKRFQTDYLSGKTQFIEIKDIDERMWFDQKALWAKAVTIGPGNWEIFRDKRLPFNPDQRPPWPQDLLFETDFRFAFDSVFLKPTTVLYSERLPQHHEAGWISFDELQLSTGKLTNMPEELAQNPELVIEASASLMGKAPLQAQIIFQLNAANKAHTVSGSLAPLALNIFNPMIENTTRFKIESGNINRFDFHFLVNNQQAHGELYFNYNDLKIEVMRLDDDAAKKMWLASLWANTAVIQSKNTNDENNPEKINYPRDEQRSVLNYWWKAILSAARQGIGIPSEK